MNYGISWDLTSRSRSQHLPSASMASPSREHAVADAFVAPTERALDGSNRGYRLLQKMGWRPGSGLGKREQGIMEPVKMKENLVCLGLGKAEEYDEMTQLATSERRKLGTEVEESAEDVVVREARGAREEQLKTELKSMQAAFYCADCRKQYATVSEMENHLSSYDHHHCKRLRDLQQQHKQQTGAAGAQQAKRRKEQRQEEVLLQRRIAHAAAAASTGSLKPSLPPSTAISTTASDSATGVDEDQAQQEKRSTTAKVGFSFGGGMKMRAKNKAARKPVTHAAASAFASAFTQD